MTRDQVWRARQALAALPSAMRAQHALALALRDVLGSPNTEAAGEEDEGRAAALLAALQAMGFPPVPAGLAWLAEALAAPEPAPAWRWYYARQGDEPYHPADSREDALAKGRQEFGVWGFVLCEAIPAPLHHDIFDADEVLEQFEGTNEDHWGEAGETDPTLAQRTELEQALAATLAAWRTRHGLYEAGLFAETRNEERVPAAARAVPHG